MVGMITIIVMVITIILTIDQKTKPHFRSTGEDDVDLRSSCKNDFEDDGDEDLADADKEETTEQEKEKEKEEKTKEKEEKEKEDGEEEEDLEYLRLNCTRMSTRRATNFSQVGFIYIFICTPFLL